MNKATTSDGKIIFVCRCLNQEDGNQDDTLMASEYYELTDSNLKHEIFIENSPFDPAANIVFKDCLNCGLNFLTQIMLGSAMQVMYTCTCGYKVTHEEYMKAFEKQTPDHQSTRSQMVAKK